MTEPNSSNSNINCISNSNTIPYCDHEDSQPSDINEVSDAPPSPDLRYVKIESLSKQAIDYNIWKELPADALSMKDRLPGRLLYAIEPSTSPDAKVRSSNDTESSRLILLSKRGRMPTLYMPTIDPPDSEGFIAPTIKWSRELLEGPIGFGRDNDARSGRPDLFGRNKHAVEPLPDVHIPTARHTYPIPPGPYTVGGRQGTSRGPRLTVGGMNRAQKGWVMRNPRSQNLSDHSSRGWPWTPRPKDVDVVLRYNGPHPFQSKPKWQWTDEDYKTLDKNPGNYEWVPKPPVPGAHPYAPTTHKSGRKPLALPQIATVKRVPFQPPKFAFRTDYKSINGFRDQAQKANAHVRAVETENEDPRQRNKELTAEIDRLIAYNTEEVKTLRVKHEVSEMKCRRAEHLLVVRTLQYDSDYLPYKSHRAKARMDSVTIQTLQSELIRQYDLAWPSDSNMHLEMRELTDRVKYLTAVFSFMHKELQQIARAARNNNDAFMLGDIANLNDKINPWMEAVDQDLTISQLREHLFSRTLNMVNLSDDYRHFKAEYHKLHSENVDDIVRACVEDIRPLHLESESILAGLELTIKEPYRGQNDAKCKAIFQLGQATAPEETQFLIGFATAVHHLGVLSWMPDHTESQAELARYGNKYADLIVTLYGVLPSLRPGDRVTNPLAGIHASRKHSASYLHPIFGSKDYPPQPCKVEPDGTLNHHDHTQAFYNPIKVDLLARKAAGTLGDSNMVIPNNIIRYAQKRLPLAALRAKSVPDFGGEPAAASVGLDSDDTASQPPLNSWWDREVVVPTRIVPTKAAAQTSNESLGKMWEDVSDEKSGGKVEAGMEGEVEDEANATSSLTPA